MIDNPQLIIEDDTDSDEGIQVIIPAGPCAFLIDDDDDVADVQVFIEGPPGPPLKDVGSRAQPTLVTSTIAAPKYRRQRSFIKGNGGPIYNPTIANPPDNGAWELYLFCTDDTDNITLEGDGSGNILLSGQCIMRKGSILYLQWDSQSQYVEGGRNEI